MRLGLKTLVCALGAAAVCAMAQADITDPEDVAAETENPYQAIIDRNVFGLRPIPPPAVVEPPKPPPPKITLTGITTIFGNKRALMKTPAPPPKPGQPPGTEEYYTLAEGQRQGPLEVLEIDENAFTVKVKYEGVVSTLDYENNGAKLVASATPVPGLVPRPGVPGGITPGIPAPARLPTPGSMPMPTRTLRLPTPTGTATSTSAGNSSYSYGGGNPNLALATSGGQVSVPLGSRSSSTPPPPDSQVSPLRQLPIEQQLLMIEAERERTKNQVAAGLLPPLPPTALTPPGSPGSITPAPAPTDQNQNQFQVRFPPRAPGLPALPQ